MYSKSELSSLGVAGMSKRYNSHSKGFVSIPFFEYCHERKLHDKEGERKMESVVSIRAERDHELGLTGGGPHPVNTAHHLSLNPNYKTETGKEQVAGNDSPQLIKPHQTEGKDETEQQQQQGKNKALWYLNRTTASIPPQYIKPYQTEGKDETEQQQQGKKKALWYLNRTTASILLLQAIYAILFTALVSYSEEAHAGNLKNSIRPMRGGFAHETLDAEIRELLQISIYITICLGLRLVCVKGWNVTTMVEFMLISCMTLQWSVLCRGLIESSSGGKVIVTIKRIIEAEFTCLSVLVCASVLSGRTSLLQLIAMKLLHVPLQLLSDRIIKVHLNVSDCGMTISSHLFGAFYGIFVILVLVNKKHVIRTSMKYAIFTEMFFSIGTFLIMIYWPSISLANTSGDAQRRSVTNTVLALMSSAVVAFPIASAMNPTRKFSMETIQDGIVAAGVATASVSPLMLEMYGAIILGALSSIVCIVFQSFIKPKLPDRFGVGLKDSFGIFVSHGIAGCIGGAVSAIMASLASSELGDYGYSLYKLYPARSPLKGTYELWEVQAYLPLPAGQGRSAAAQAGYQLLGLLVAVILASVGGSVTGLVLRLKIFEESEEKIHETIDKQHQCGLPTCQLISLKQLYNVMFSQCESQGCTCKNAIGNYKDKMEGTPVNTANNV